MVYPFTIMSTRHIAFAIPSLLVVALLALLVHDRTADAADGETGRIVGVVEFSGPAPKRPMLARDTDPVCAKTPKASEEVVVTDGRLRDVHVRIKVGTAGTHEAPERPVRVQQLECMYRPRVVGIVQGQDVVITNGDPTYHNVRAAQNKRTLWNLSQPASAPALTRKNLGKAGEVVSLHCDVHPWMQAFAVITDHPFFDVTADDGAFAIEGVAPGTYELQSWHPKLGLKTTKVVVEAGKTSKIEFRY